MSPHIAFRDYLAEVGRDLATGSATEHTHRPALKELLIALDPGVRPINEPTRIACGAPDYIVTRDDLPVGYVEAKDVGQPLDEIERDEQLRRYRDSLSNLILTDYLEFRWFKDGEKQQTARIAYVGDTGKLRPDCGGQRQAAALFSAFFAQKPPIIAKPADLAKRMAALARVIRDIVMKALGHDRNSGSPLRDQLKGFQQVLIHDLSEQQFADMYAQTIAYGLFAARVNAPADEHFTREHAAYDLPKTNPFLRQMFGQIAGPELDERIAWAVDDLAELLARARMDLVLEDFGKRTRQEDPVVHFYETFLAAYDPEMRQVRGVYYTPEPVVSYIVRSVDYILKTEFGLPDGLADNSMIEVPVAGKPDETRMVHRVQILDPACGTGTFLAQVIETIRATVVAKHGAGMWPGYVHDHLLPRLYGFELLMAPYAIAHLKLGLRLKETGYDVEQSERLRVYLTNTLEEPHEREHGQMPLFGAWLAEEANRASEVKRELPIMVVLGNPPYSGHSANNGRWIRQLVRGRDSDSGGSTHSYFEVDGEPVGNTQLKWLSDDYVKFIRFGQWRVERTGQGILAFVTNHTYLDSPTFPGMRKALMAEFDKVFVLDLHGNAKRETLAPDGAPDQNVFDIQQGVAISISVKSGSSQTALGAVFHHEVWGSRKTKYSILESTDLATTDWTPIAPRPPRYTFSPENEALVDEFDACWSVPSIFSLTGNPAPGIVTTHDSFAISFTREEAISKVQCFLSTPSETEARQLFRLCSQDQWSYEVAKRELASLDWQNLVTPILYRPFDVRWTIWDKNVAVHRRERITRFMRGDRNLALLTSRMTKGEPFCHVQVTRLVPEVICMSPKTSNNAFVFPLYLPSQGMSGRLIEADGQRDDGSPRVNLAPEFVSGIEQRTGLCYSPRQSANAQYFGPEAVLGYIVAVLHAPTYRRRYESCLRGDFPHIPITSDRDLFRDLCRLGSRLITLHLMEADDLEPVTTYPVPGDNCVGRVRYAELAQDGQHGRVWINRTQYFEGVAPEVWMFRVGGYQVCEKWLRDRKGRQLAYDDLTHYQYVVAALGETIALMCEIDEAIEAHGGWPLR